MSPPPLAADVVEKESLLHMLQRLLSDLVLNYTLLFSARISGVHSYMYVIDERYHI